MDWLQVNGHFRGTTNMRDNNFLSSGIWAG